VTSLVFLIFGMSLMFQLCFPFADLVTVMSLVILIFLFSLQRFGTAKVSFLFAPIFTTWFLVLAILGVYNIIKWDKTVFTAFNPLHIVYFFERNGKLGWEHLGGIVLCMTGINTIPPFFLCSAPQGPRIHGFKTT
jgi:K+ transporter